MSKRKRRTRDNNVAAEPVQLSRGITAFRPSEADRKRFHAVCREAVRKLYGRLIWVDEAPPKYRSYLVGILEVSNEIVGILINREYVAFIEVPEEDLAPVIRYQTCAPMLNFIDMPALADVFRTHDGFEVLTVAQLTQQPTRDQCQDLDAQELEDVRYWNPQTVGQLIFNFWD